MEQLFLTDANHQSGRTAVVTEEADSVWLYLTAPGQQRPERDCWLLNTPDAPSRPLPHLYRERQSPPPAPADFTLPGAVQTVPTADRWSFVWSDDGMSVAALLDDEPIGVASGARPRGLARFIKAGAAPWAEPWDESFWLRTFMPGAR